MAQDATRGATSFWRTLRAMQSSEKFGDVVLVAYSSGCASIVHWAQNADQTQFQKMQGALLVAPSDPDSPNYPVGLTGFGPVPLKDLPFESIVVASTNDPYITVERARQYAKACHSRLVIVCSRGDPLSDNSFVGI